MDYYDDVLLLTYNDYVIIIYVSERLQFASLCFGRKSGKFVERALRNRFACSFNTEGTQERECVRERARARARARAKGKHERNPSESKKEPFEKRERL